MELKEKRKLQKLANRYIHTITQTYPLENVRHMLGAWETKKKLAEEFIEGYDQRCQETVTNVDHQLHARFEAIRNDTEAYQVLSREEKIEKFFARAAETYEEQEKLLAQKETIIAEEKAKALEQLANMKLQAEANIEEMNLALKFWRSPKSDKEQEMTLKLPSGVVNG